MVLCRGCPAFPTASPPTPHGGRTWMPDHTWLLSSPTRSAATPKVKRRPGQPAPRSRAGRADRRPAGMARRHPGRPQRPATHRATPARPRRPNLPTATRHATRRRGLPTRLAMAATARHRSPQRDRRPIPAGADRKVEQPHPGRLRRHPARAVGGRRRTPTRRPPRRSPLVAHPRSATRKRRTRTPQPPTPSQRPGAPPRRHPTSSDPCRARRRLPRSARAAETSPPRITTPEMCFGGLLPNPLISIQAALPAPALRSACLRAGFEDLDG